MSDTEDTGGRLQELTINEDDNEATSSEEGESPAETALRLGLETILDRYPTRLEWEKASAEELEKIEEDLAGIDAEDESCNSLVTKVTFTLAVRQTLIDNNYGNISFDMVQNQKEWNHYVAQVFLAREDVIKGFNWLELLLIEWKFRESAFEQFWDAFEGEGQSVEADDMTASVLVIALALLPRKDFLEKQFAETMPEMEILWKVAPKWIEWDVVPRT